MTRSKLKEVVEKGGVSMFVFSPHEQVLSILSSYM